MQTILVPIDFSDATDAVVRESIKLARALAARLVVAHVLALPQHGLGYGSGGDAVSFQAREYDVDQRLAAIERQVGRQHGFFETYRLIGAVDEQIVKLARELPASYLVIGTHGRGAVYERLVGSTAGALLRSSPCPVLVVPVRTAVLPSLTAQVG